MKFCTTKDPLLDYFLVTQKVNLLALPRTGVELGSFFVLHKNGTVDGIPLSDLIEPAIAPPARKEDTMSEVSRIWSEKMNIKAALSLHRMFLAVFGAEDQIGKIAATYAQNGACEFRVHIPAHKREYLSVQDFQAALKGCQLRKHPQVDGDTDRIYACSAVWSAPGLVFDVTDKDGKQVKASAPLKALVDSEMSFDFTGNVVDHVIFHEKEGRTAVFGVELMQIQVIDNVITLVDQRPRARMRKNDVPKASGGRAHESSDHSDTLIDYGDVLITTDRFLEVH